MTCLNQGENRGCRADAEGERQHGHCRESRVFAQHAKAEAHIVNHGFERRKAPAVAIILLSLLDPA